MKKKQFKIFKDMPVLETERLVFKKIVESDLSDVYEYAKDPKVSEYLLWEPHKSIDYTRSYIDFLQLLYRKKQFYDWGIHLKENMKMIGTCGFTNIDIKTNSATVGYVINSNFWGQGIATEALKKLKEFAKAELKLSGLRAKIIKENQRSAKVLEKCGFKIKEEQSEKMKVKGTDREILTYYIEI